MRMAEAREHEGGGLEVPAALRLCVDLFGRADSDAINAFLAQFHYLGACRRGVGWYADEFGVIVIARPASRRLPSDWLEVSRWCLIGTPNGGSRQWARAARWLRVRFPRCSTVVSYSDPSVGHTGALYRACNWLWAPTWLRLRPPPSGHGDWGTGRQCAKDRWVFPLRRDDRRASLLAINDDALMRTIPWASYREGCGGDYRRWIGERAVRVMAEARERELAVAGSDDELLTPADVARKSGQWRARSRRRSGVGMGMGMGRKTARRDVDCDERRGK